MDLGTVTFTLTQPAVLTGTATTVSSSVTCFTDQNGILEGMADTVYNNHPCTLHFNDEMQPSFTGYNVTVVSSSSQTIAGYPQKWYLSGGPTGTINLNVATPYYSSVVQYPQPIITSPAASGQQSIQGPLDMNGFTISNVTYSPPAAVAPAVITVPYSSAPVFDASQGNGFSATFQITLNGDVPSSTLTGIVAGELLTFLVRQDSFGGHRFTAPANLPLATIGAQPGNTSAQTFVVDASGTKVVPIRPMAVN